MLPLGIGKNAYRMQEDILFCKERGNANSTFNELVVMSPFLSESVIADFNLTDRAFQSLRSCSYQSSMRLLQDQVMIQFAELL